MSILQGIKKTIKENFKPKYDTDFMYHVMMLNYKRLKVLAVILWLMELGLFMGYKEVNYPREPIGLFLFSGIFFLPIIIKYTKNIYTINYKMLQIVLYFYVFTVILLGVHLSIYQYGNESMYILVMVLMGIASSVSIKPKNFAAILFLSYIVFGMYTLFLDVSNSEIVILRLNILILHVITWAINKFVVDLKVDNYIITKELKEKNEYLEKVAKKDSMTKLYNHDNSLMILNESIEEAQKEGKQISVCLLDLDDFKNINDKYGHQTGDRVINRVAEEIRNCVRAEDIVGRYGGEEFIVVLKGITKDTAYRIIDRIRQKVEEIEFERGFNITFSAGLSDTSETINSEELIKLADVRLYKIKKGTKNAVGLE